MWWVFFPKCIFSKTNTFPLGASGLYIDLKTEKQMGSRAYCNDGNTWHYITTELLALSKENLGHWTCTFVTPSRNCHGTQLVTAQSQFSRNTCFLCTYERLVCLSITKIFCNTWHAYMPQWQEQRQWNTVSGFIDRRSIHSKFIKQNYTIILRREYPITRGDGTVSYF